MFVPLLLSVALVVALPTGVSDPQKNSPTVQKASGSVEWTDPAGDVERQSTSGGKRPGFDVVKLALTSNGTALTIAATLATPPKGDFASPVVRLHIDTDNNPKTGFDTFWSKQPGFELRADLGFCVQYQDGSEACVGGSDAKVKGMYSMAAFGRMIDSMNVKDFYQPFRWPKGTLQGAVLTASLPYADLGVKPGQTVRILARESDGPYDGTADFPAVALTLK